MKKILTIFIMMMLVMIGVVSATTLEEGAIIKAADRLVETQNNDGTWEWLNPDLNKTNGGGACPSNIVGVTARGLVDAYQAIGTQGYLDAAEISGVAIVACGFDITADKYYSQDIEFLVELGEATGDSTYTDKAVEIMNYFMTLDNRYCPSEGCTAAELAAFYENYYSGTNYYPGMTEWQLASWVRAAQVTGKTSWANDMISEMNVDVGTYFYIDSLGDYGVIGLAGVVDATGDAAAKQKLIDLQETDGSWGDPNGVVQDTAYAVMALMGKGEAASATWGKNWLMNNQDTNGGWIESDSKEYTEVDSEALQAIFDVMAMSNVGGEGSDFVALTVPDSIDYGTLFSTPGYETDAQEIPLTNVGSLNVLVTPIWASGAEVFKHIKFSDDNTTYGMIIGGVGAEGPYSTNIGATWISGTTFLTVKNIWTKIKIASGLTKLTGPQSGTIYFQATETA